MLYEEIKKRREQLGLSVEDVAKELGVNRSTVYRYENSDIEKMPITILKPLAKVLQTSPEELLGWNDKPAAPKNAFPADFSNLVKIPVVGRVAAGIHCLAEENIEGYEYVEADDITPGEEYMFLRVTGDSMYPMFMEGDLILVRKQPSVDSGSYAVVIVDGEDGVVKKIVYGSDWIELQSVNPMYKPRRFEGEDVLQIQVVGIVKQIKRKF